MREGIWLCPRLCQCRCLCHLVLRMFAVCCACVCASDACGMRRLACANGHEVCVRVCLRVLVSGSACIVAGTYERIRVYTPSQRTHIRTRARRLSWTPSTLRSPGASERLYTTLRLPECIIRNARPADKECDGKWWWHNRLCLQSPLPSLSQSLLQSPWPASPPLPLLAYRQHYRRRRCRCLCCRRLLLLLPLTTSSSSCSCR